MGRPKGSTKKKPEEVDGCLPIPEDDKKEAQVKQKPNPKFDIAKKIMNEINRKVGKPVLKMASEELPLERIPFGNKHLDKLTGGGIPHRRFNIIWGPKSAGKTTLCYKLIAEAQKQGKVCALIDMERTFDPIWAQKMGVNLEELILINEFNSAEEAMDAFISITRSKGIDLVVLDSIQALSPKGEQETKKGVEKSLEDDTMALLARKLSQFFRIASGSVYSSNVAIVLVGQARTNLGGFIAFDQLSGGHALHHWSTLTLQVRRGAKSDNPVKKVTVDGKKEEVTLGFSCNIKLEKRKVSSEVEGSEVKIPFYYEDGFREE